MKIEFKLVVLMLITSLHVSAQIEDIYHKSFATDNISTLQLDLEGVYVVVEPSEDNNVHFNYSLRFENYSKKEKEAYLKKIETSAQVIDDILEFTTRGSNTSNDVSYSIESLMGISYEGDYISFKGHSQREFRKSKQYFLAINSSSRGKSLKEYLKSISEVRADGKKRKINSKNVKILRSTFTIKMPPELQLRLRAVHSNMVFKLDLNSELHMNARNTGLKFQNITHPMNTITVVNGNFRSNTISGGSYTFNHVDEVQIAEVKNVIMDNEFSSVNIGEIGRGVEIVDFNSKFWIHNFSKDFGDFIMHTEYSEINLFYPEHMEYYIETYGNDTVHYTKNINTEIPANKKNRLSKMMVIGNETSSNKIQINTVHGIVRFGEDFIDLEE